MSENAELYSRIDDNEIRTKLIDYLKRHNIEFNSKLETEQLRKLYINNECTL